MSISTSFQYQSGTISTAGPQAQALLRWLRGLRFERHRLELVTICAGALLAAHAGALAGRRATTHHHHLDELRQVEPRCEVIANRVFVIDDFHWNLWSNFGSRPFHLVQLALYLAVSAAVVALMHRGAMRLSLSR